MSGVISVDVGGGRRAIIDECDAGIAMYQWTARRTGSKWYAERRQRVGGRTVTIRLHRAVMGSPVGLEIDHINGDGLDCRRSNLRVATRPQNSWNRPARSDNVTGLKGVTFHRQTGKWMARIKVHGAQHYLGLYGSPEGAARAYDAAARKYCGEFAWCNFPEEET